MFKKLVIFLVLSCFFVNFIGCAGMNLNPAELKSDYAKGNFANTLYGDAYADYQKYAALPNLTDQAKELLRIKREIIYNLGEPSYGAIAVLNNMVQTGEPITDEAWNALLGKLLNLETGWYTNDTQYASANPQVFSLDPKAALSKVPEEQRTNENLNKILYRTSIEASLVDGGAKKQALWEGLLLELIRAGIHAVRALLAQRGMDEAQLQEAYNNSYAQFQQLDVNQLIKIN